MNNCINESLREQMQLAIVELLDQIVLVEPEHIWQYVRAISDLYKLSCSVDVKEEPEKQEEPKEPKGVNSIFDVTTVEADLSEKIENIKKFLNHQRNQIGRRNPRR